MNEAPLTCPPGVRKALMALLDAGAEVEARLERSLEPMGLSLAKMGALHTLIEAGEPVPLGQLAERLCCVRSNVTQLVDRLEADRLVRRVPDPADRRSVRAEVTEEGRARFAAALRAREAAEAELLSGFADDELERLAGWCLRVAERAG
jgi:DNA-binding MarR family transcriptional regulator